MRALKSRQDERDLPQFQIADRRGQGRGGQNGEPDRRYLVSMIVGTYREMPGLCLHLNQAARLFGLRTTTCRIVLDDLVRVGQLRRAPDGQYTSL